MKAVLIVEGLNDADQIHKAFNGNKNIITLVTEGTKINNRIRTDIETYLSEGVDVYILSDPDDAGARLAQMIQSWYPQLPRLEVDDRQCAYYTGKRFKSGVEYSSYDYLKKIISPLIGLEYKEKVLDINWD